MADLLAGRVRRDDHQRDDLSFLGLESAVPAISWGVLLRDMQNIENSPSRPWLLVVALPAIVVILAFNFLGDGLRDAADPNG